MKRTEAIERLIMAAKNTRISQRIIDAAEAELKDLHHDLILDEELPRGWPRPTEFSYDRAPSDLPTRRSRAKPGVTEPTS